MLTDSLCPVTWRARPRSFTSLMTLYESNYIRLGWLVPGLRGLAGSLRSAIPGAPLLELSVVEQCRYTTALELTYLFGEGASVTREPGLSVRVYHDARLAEACGAAGSTSQPALRKLAAAVEPGRSARWSCNMLLNKWLEYCVDSGYRFAAPAT
jgi:uncharacterized protein YqiB (DUF1249 family)